MCEGKCNSNNLKMEVLHVSAYSGTRKRDNEPFVAYTLVGKVGESAGKIVSYQPAAENIKAGDMVNLQVVSRPSRFGAELVLDVLI